MAPEKEQVKPLAPAGYRTRSDEVESLSMQPRLGRPRRCIKCCGCVTAVFLILAVIILVLASTVFHIKDPKIRMNSLTIQRLELINGDLRRVENITVIADVSVKNPNAASFRYGNSTTTVFYRGEMVGEGTIPSGYAKARHTLRMNTTMYIIPDKISAVPKFSVDWSSGALAMSTYTKLSGRVKILHITKKNVVGQMNCTLTYNVSSRSIQDRKCHSSVRV